VDTCSKQRVGDLAPAATGTFWSELVDSFFYLETAEPDLIRCNPE
jgi:hypothetical protein